MVDSCGLSRNEGVDSSELIVESAKWVRCLSRPHPMPRLSRKAKKELSALAALRDTLIDFSDQPEVRDWSHAMTGKFYRPIKNSLHRWWDVSRGEGSSRNLLAKGPRCEYGTRYCYVSCEGGPDAVTLVFSAILRGSNVPKRKKKLSLKKAVDELTALAEKHLATLPEEAREARVGLFAERDFKSDRGGRTKPSERVRTRVSRASSRGH